MDKKIKELINDGKYSEAASIADAYLDDFDNDENLGPMHREAIRNEICLSRSYRR